MKTRLSKTTVDAAQPAAARSTVWDEELSGFGLRIEKNGSKTFVVKYRSGGGGRNAPQRLMSLGRYPTLKVADARAKAEKVLAAVMLGQDPAGDLAEKRRQMTVTALGSIHIQGFTLVAMRDS